MSRFFYLSTGCDADKTKSLMDSLKNGGKYDITDDMKAFIGDFVGEYADQKECAGKIKDLYDKTGYVIDTHTAVAGAAYDKYVKETGDETVTVIASTASPFKFSKAVLKAIDDKLPELSDFELTDKLSTVANVEVPNAVKELKTAEIKHKKVCAVSEMKQCVLDNMGI